MNKKSGWDREAIDIYMKDVIRGFSANQIEYMAWWLTVEAEDRSRDKKYPDTSISDHEQGAKKSLEDYYYPEK